MCAIEVLPNTLSYYRLLSSYRMMEMTGSLPSCAPAALEETILHLYLLLNAQDTWFRWEVSSRILKFGFSQLWL